jgi:hypothetical protein
MKTQRRTRVRLFTATACGVLFVVIVTIGHAQQAADWYALGRAALEGFKRQAVEYGPDEGEAIEKVGRACGECGDQISAALHQGLVTERQKCHANQECKDRADANYEKIKKELLDALKTLCECREHAVADRYSKQRFEQAKQEYQQTINSTLRLVSRRAALTGRSR